MTAASSTVPDYILAAVASDHRLAADTRRDAGRKPAEVLAFFGIKPGDHVAELMAGTGYHAGLLCEVVGKAGKVFAHNTPGAVARRNGNPLRTRMAKRDLSQMETPVSRSDEIDLPAGLDAVLICNTYHDAVWTGMNRPQMLGRIRTALKPGGVLGVVDHRAQAGSGFDHAKTYHRIDKQAVIAEITTAGFVLDGESTVLENPDDPLTIDVHDEAIAGRTSRFVLRFHKP